MMNMRWAIAVFALATAGCSVSADGSSGSQASENLACAIGKAAKFSDDCSVERIKKGDDTLLIIRHGDGGFRRLQVLMAKGGLVTADGAEEAVVQDEGTFVLVTVGADRYRIPVGTGSKSAHDSRNDGSVDGSVDGGSN